MDLALTLQKALQSMRDGKTMDAITALETVLENAEFMQAKDLEDIRARTLSLYGQALLDQQRFADARSAAEAAMALAKALKDTAGQNQIRKLLQDISARQMETLKMKGFLRKQQAEQTQSLEALLKNATDNSSLDTVISQAALQLRIGRVEDAKKLAEHVLAATSTSAKDRVIAHLLLSHADPKTSAFHLEKAWAIADEADDFNLLKAISNTADELNQPIAVLHGPKMNS